MNEEYKIIFKRLEDLPFLIAEKEREILKLKNDSIDTQYWLNRTEANIKQDIAIETDDDGKRKYSNQDMRDAEFYNRTQSDDEYKNLKEKLDLTETNRQITEIELKKLVNEFNALRYQIKILELTRKDLN